MGGGYIMGGVGGVGGGGGHTAQPYIEVEGLPCNALRPDRPVWCYAAGVSLQASGPGKVGSKRARCSFGSRAELAATLQTGQGRKKGTPKPPTIPSAHLLPSDWCCAVPLLHPYKYLEGALSKLRSCFEFWVPLIISAAFMKNAPKGTIV